MSLKEDLADGVERIFADSWDVRKGQKVPDTDDLKLGNDAVELEAAILYADLTDSTGLVEHSAPHLAAEIYKSYLWCAAKVIRSEGGRITSFDGDRIMAVYFGGSKCTSAARTALKIHWTVDNLINPALKAQYPSEEYVVEQTVGIDQTSIWVVRGGIRNGNDLLWIGDAANVAAKLCGLSHKHPSWITKAVYDQLQDSLKVNKGRDIWQARTWTAFENRPIYRSNWTWSL